MLRVLTRHLLQASRFKKMGLSAVAVNGDTYSNEIHKVCLLLDLPDSVDGERDLRRFKSSSIALLLPLPTCA